MMKSINVPNVIIRKFREYFFLIRKYIHMKDRRIFYGFPLALILSCFYGPQYIVPFWCFAFLVVEDYFTNLVDSRMIDFMTCLFVFCSLANYYLGGMNENVISHNPLTMLCYFWILFMGIHLLSYKKRCKKEPESPNNDGDEKPEIIGMAMMPAAYIGLILSYFAPYIGLLPKSLIVLEANAEFVFWIFSLSLFVIGSLKVYILTKCSREEYSVYYRFGDGDACIMPVLSMLFSTFSEAFIMIWLVCISFIVMFVFKFKIRRN